MIKATVKYYSYDPAVGKAFWDILYLNNIKVIKTRIGGGITSYDKVIILTKDYDVLTAILASAHKVSKSPHAIMLVKWKEIPDYID